MKAAQRLAIGYIRTKFRLLSLLSKKKAAREAFRLFCTPLRRYKKPLPPIFEKAEPLKMQLGKITVRGWRWNRPSAKKVLIIHGYESAAANFDRYIKPLAKKGYEVLAFDAPAHGRSGSKTITAPLYKDMIKQVNAEYGPINAFIAHSFGGLIVSLALEEMDHTAHHKLVLIAPATETTTAVDSFFRFLRLNNETRTGFDELILKAGGKPAEWYSIRRAMHHIKATTRWFHDTDDDTTPLSDALKVKEENHPGLEFVITTGLGHRKIYRDNKVSKAIIDFL